MTRVAAAARIRDPVVRASAALGIKPIDVGITAVVIAVVELNVVVGTGPGASPLDALAYIFGAIMPLPILLRRRWPRQVLIACSALLFAYYSSGHRRNLSPAPLLAVPLYDAALAGFLTLAIVIPAVYMAIGLFVVGTSTHESLVSLAAHFLPSIALLALAIALGEVVRGRHALAAEAAQRLRAAEEEREAEAARRVAEERLRIARELHDTVAHSMATITVQAGSALHVLGSGGPRDQIRAALTAIRATSKSALADMRAALGQLRGGDVAERAGTADGGSGGGGLDRLPALRDAVQAAGVPVSVTIEGDAIPLPGQVDHAAYRILQESLTNVLRHAGPDAAACVRLCYEPGALTIEVLDNGVGAPTGSAGGAGDEGGAYLAGGAGGAGHEDGAGHGIAGMRERAASAGGELSARPRDGGGFEVIARLPACADDGGGTREGVKRLIR
ncbi:MAG: sensor histidine kinase [Micromonosporaceae bacterium]